jgi:hypothetical protein
MNKARLIVVDIETYRTRIPSVIERLRREAVEKRPAQNTLKELKVEWDTSAAREARALEAIGKTSVDVLLAEPLCVYWETLGEDGIQSIGEVDFMAPGEGIAGGMDPMDILAVGGQLVEVAAAWAALTGPETIWVGHNLKGFDLPVLVNQFRRYEVTPPESFPQFIGRRWLGRVYDTMERCPTKTGYLSLEDACEAYDVRAGAVVKWNGVPMDGSRVGAAYEAREYEILRRYCALDVTMAYRLYMAMTGNDSWGTYDRAGSVAEQIGELRGAEGLTEGQRALGIVSVLERAGMI